MHITKYNKMQPETADFAPVPPLGEENERNIHGL